MGVGLFFGIVPLWGFQFALAIITAVACKLNKVIVGVAAQISVPPLIPFVLFASVKTGELLFNKHIDFSFSKAISLGTVHQIGWLYLVGATVLSLFMGVAGFVVTWVVLKIIGYKKA